MRAQQMVARAARLDPARTGEPGCDHAADGSLPGDAEQGGRLHRLEGELLALGIDQRHHVRKRGACLHGDDEFVRLIGRHGIERRQIEHGVGRHRLADPAPGTMADDLERLVVGEGRPHRLFDIRCVTYFQGIHANRLAVTPWRGGRIRRGRPVTRHLFY